VPARSRRVSGALGHANGKSQTPRQRRNFRKNIPVRDGIAAELTLWPLECPDRSDSLLPESWAERRLSGVAQPAPPVLIVVQNGLDRFGM
jgi:hypothetical protein